jgi:uncharacterized membrane protein
MMVYLILFYIFFPAVILFLTQKFSVMNKIGAVLIAYFFGLIIGNSGLIISEERKANISEEHLKEVIDKIKTEETLNSDELYKYTIYQIQDKFSSISVLLAIPLLLFSADVKRWFKVAGKTMLSGLLVTIAVLITVVSGYFIFMQDVENGNQVSALLTGIYTGGTPNGAAIKTALNINNDLFIITHTYDMLVCTIFILLALTVFQRFGLLFLPKYKTGTGNSEKENDELIAELENYDGILKRENFLHLLKAVGISLLIVIVGVIISMIVPKDFSTVVAILSITSLGIGLALIPKINKIPKTFHVGMYFILIFSLVVASMGDLTSIGNISADIFLYVVFVVFGITILTFIFSAIFKIDVDTTIVTMTSLIFSPPFVPVVAAKLKNKEIIISGLTVGIIGYAIGNYLGILMAYVLK